VREPPAFDPFKTPPDAELVASAYATPLRSAPGEKWEYSNLGYHVLVEIINRTWTIGCR
jgi:CubicO group peptidase (beta-lactamase class C family)